MNSSTGTKPKLKEKRKISVPTASSSHKTLEAFKLKSKRKMSLPDENTFNTIYDPMAKANEGFFKKRGHTGISYDDKMDDHYCLWDSEYPENPRRVKNIIKRCNELGLIERCHRLPAREATKEELQLGHFEGMIDLLESLKTASEDKLKEVSAKYDSIYINNATFAAGQTAVGCVLEATTAVVEGTVHNAMALVRPPGHHATKNDYCGYSFFNNVAIAAKYAVDKLNMKRVMIVDWDVHHGQGTQQTFYNDKRVLYFSMHRYEHGSFWPNLREGEFDYIGEGEGVGFNFNIPINETGMLNQDYMHICHNILLPVSYEFNPDLMLVSAGFDSAIGDEKGLMKLTPAFFAHMTHSLMSLAEGKIVAILEGGYFMETLAEGAALTLRTLLGDTCPPLLDPLLSPSNSIQETVFNVMGTHRNYWKCFQFLSPEVMTECKPLEPHPSLNYPPRTENSKYDIMGCYPVSSEDDRDAFLTELERLKAGTPLSVPNIRTCLVYDSLMEKHKNDEDCTRPERPSRTKAIFEMLGNAGILKRVHRLKSRKATLRELQQVHTLEWVTVLQKLDELSLSNRLHLESKYNSVYFNKFSTESTLCAVGSLLQVIDSVCGGESRSGIAVIRPPGHHAESAEPNGFCLVNNVAVGVTYALKKYNLKRILILDWDIHHGNGIQNIFESNPKVLYVSIHAYCNATFFPCSPIANSSFVGKKSGHGYNVNIPWSRAGMADGDYLSAFFRVILPICYEFNPELVMVSAGFDAAVNDPLGKCHVTPECFGHMTHFLMSLASGKVILALEGGYNLLSISTSMTVCAKALLGDPLPSIEKTTASASAVKTINEVIKIQKQFWKLLYDQDDIRLKVSGYIKEESPPSSPFITPLEVTPFSTPRKDSAPVSNLIEELKKLSIVTDATESRFVAESWSNVKCSKTDVQQEEKIDQDNQVEGAVGGSNDSNSLLLIQQIMQDEGMHAVIPLSWCPHLEFVNPVPEAGLSVTASCQTCSECTENWICLVCYQVYCSRFCKGDMLRHKTATDHQITLSFSDLSVWCYECNSYVSNKILDEALIAATESKFGK